MAKLPDFNPPQTDHRHIMASIILSGESQREMKHLTERQAEIDFAAEKGALPESLLADRERLSRDRVAHIMQHNEANLLHSSVTNTEPNPIGFKTINMFQAIWATDLALLNAHKAVTPAEKRDAAMEMKVAQKYLDEAFTA